MIDVKELAGVAMNARGQLSDAIPDPQVTLAALAFANELGSLLWRMQAGQDVSRSTVDRATKLLAVQMRTDSRFKRRKFTGLDREQKRERNAGRRYVRETADIVERFAARVILEWVFERCGVCSGRGKLGLTDTAIRQSSKCATCGGSGRQLVDEERIPFAAGLNGPLVLREYEPCSACNGLRRTFSRSKSERTQLCPHCRGTCIEPINHPERARALGVDSHVYEKHWRDPFAAMLDYLDQVDERASRAVTRQRR
ncbi:hypothetical protein D7S86_24595 [Pararobbsia silviterrae]|uniref:CR-type domain-containing protein n=1 Tax=Pararobbsia silviterrae TaxID=1792498 RepID=A0A494X8V8_9BURK|nr:hypothetical protein D7S86_24595 [Pararobbsia silviterrae]